jgi:hypothetical protein
VRPHGADAMRDARPWRPGGNLRIAESAPEGARVLLEWAHEHMPRPALAGVGGSGIEELDQVGGLDADDLDRLRERALGLNGDVESELERKPSGGRVLLQPRDSRVDGHVDQLGEFAGPLRLRPQREPRRVERDQIVV